MANPGHAIGASTRSGVHSAFPRWLALRDHTGPMACPLPRAPGRIACVGRMVPYLQSRGAQRATPDRRPPCVDHRHAIGPGRQRGQGAQTAPTALANGGRYPKFAGTSFGRERGTGVPGDRCPRTTARRIGGLHQRNRHALASVVGERFLPHQPPARFTVWPLACKAAMMRSM